MASQEARSDPSVKDAPPPATAFRAVAAFALDGDLRFLSHHDEVRLLTRALVRARWPIAYTAGFNPRARIVLPLPRSVGMASECQLMIVWLREQRCPAELADSLAATLPRGAALQGVTTPVPRGMPHARSTSYEVRLELEDGKKLAARIQRLLACEQLCVERGFGPKRPKRRVDIRPYIEMLTTDGVELRMRQVFEAQRTARPSEIITELGLDADVYNSRVRRVVVEWDMELAGPTARPATPERNSFAHQEKGTRKGTDPIRP